MIVNCCDWDKWQTSKIIGEIFLTHVVRDIAPSNDLTGS